MNEILICAKENYKLSHYLMCTKSRKKAAGPSSREGFKQRPDCEAENSFSLENRSLETTKAEKRHIH